MNIVRLGCTLIVVFTLLAVQSERTIFAQAPDDSSTGIPHTVNGQGNRLAPGKLLEVVQLEPTGGQASSSQTNSSQAVSSQDEEPPRRGLPAPIDSPPFPSGEWQIGGTNPIGAPNTDPTYALMKILGKVPGLGDFLKKERINVSGWVDVGGNLSTSWHSNFPAAYLVYPNRADLDQVVLKVERKPDTVQTDHIDWGFLVTNFYGIDYRFTTAKGYFSTQLLKYNRQYGYDPILFYGDIYIPYIAKGMNVRIGRFLSIPDIEAQLAPDNYMYTHSIMYTFDVYTQTGIVTSTKLNNNWTVQLGLTDGNDIAPWVEGAMPSGLAGVQWISNSNNDSVYLVADTINSGHYAYNNIQEYVATWSHRFNKRLHTKTEAWYMWENRVPTHTLPAGVVAPGVQRTFTGEWAILNYLEFKLSKKDYLSLRNEFMNDPKGQRTGYATEYSSHGIGWAHWFNSWLGIRPEFRFERSYAVPAYNRGTHQNQFILAADLIVRY